MLTIPFLILVFVIPATFWFYGKRFLGSATHPAALFILAWIASAFLLNFAEAVAANAEAISLLWVVVNFAVFALLRKFRKKSVETSDEMKTPSDENP